jgi:hypothetical protein
MKEKIAIKKFNYLNLLDYMIGANLRIKTYA